jgi:hypothetical protein
MDIAPEEMEEKKKMVLEMRICEDCPSRVECGEQGGFCFPTIGNG